MKNILITGLPGCGKTTMIRKLAEIFKEFNAAGFYTTEIVEDNQRTGFLVGSLFGDTRVFAHVNLNSKHVAGKYRIDIKGFEALLDSVFFNEKKTGVYFIDEIGKMHCQSKKFSKLIVDLLDAEKPFIASISDKGTGLISDIKKRDDVMIVEIKHENADAILKMLTMKIRDLLLE
ncbi:MAG: AAA family ATPase [Nitrospirae bacterium]|nr:AAA family ATPase [Nitrospirota bacterium]